MRVAYVCADPGVPVFGHKGCSVHVQEVIRAMRRRGVDVELLATNVGDPAPEDLGDINVHVLPAASRSADPAARERAALLANDYLRIALDRLDPIDAVYERYSLWSFAGMEYSRDRSVPGVLEVNAPLLDEQARYRTVCNPEAATDIARRAFGAAAALVAVSDEVADWIRGHGGVGARQLHVVPNGVDVDRFRPGLPPARHASLPDTFVVGFVGSMRPWHGLEVLVDAFSSVAARVSGARLLAVGDGPARAAAEAALAERGLSARAEFTGAAKPTAVPGLLASMDVAVAPYPALTGFYFSPLKLYEYMAMGLPVVASRIGAVARTIHDGVTGLLCEPGDPRSFADAMTHLANDPALRARLGSAAREAAVARHTWDAVAERLLELMDTPTGPRLSREAGVAS
jgi:glycosyltransferase involved in cell wall biosynthesis